jgi:hypothetical protein
LLIADFKRDEESFESKKGVAHAGPANKDWRPPARAQRVLGREDTGAPQARIAGFAQHQSAILNPQSVQPLL